VIRVCAASRKILARESYELARIKEGGVPQILQTLGCCETAVLCAVVFAFIGMIRGLNFVRSPNLQPLDDGEATFGQ
jgi:hypothetical protein